MRRLPFLIGALAVLATPALASDDPIATRQQLMENNLAAAGVAGGILKDQLDYSQPPCTNGYRPRGDWRPPTDLSDGPIFPARCADGPPFAMRGSNYAPGSPGNPSPGRLYRTAYDPGTGIVEGAVDKRGRPVRFLDQGNLSMLGEDAWKWLLVGPVVSR